MKGLSNSNFIVITLNVIIMLSYCTINQEMALHKLYYEPVLSLLFALLGSPTQNRYLPKSSGSSNSVWLSLTYQAGANFISNEHGLSLETIISSKEECCFPFIVYC